MKGRDDVYKDGFKKGESGNPNGRPKKLETLIQEHFLGEHNFRLSKSQTNELIESFLSKPMGELVELSNNKELPFWIALLVKKATADYKKGSMEILEKLWDRVHGKPKQTNEVTGQDGKDLIPKITIEIVKNADKSE